MARPPYVTEFLTIGEAQKQVEVPTNALALLGVLLEEPGATPSRLHRVTGVPEDTLSKRLKAMRLLGVVDFDPDAKDQRVKHYYLTPKGKQQAVVWLTARGIPFDMDEIAKVPVIKPRKQPQSRIVTGE